MPTSGLCLDGDQTAWAQSSLVHAVPLLMDTGGQQRGLRSGTLGLSLERTSVCCTLPLPKVWGLNLSLCCGHDHSAPGGRGEGSPLGPVSSEPKLEHQVATAAPRLWIAGPGTAESAPGRCLPSVTKPTPAVSHWGRGCPEQGEVCRWLTAQCPREVGLPGPALSSAAQLWALTSGRAPMASGPGQWGEVGGGPRPFAAPFLLIKPGAYWRGHFKVVAPPSGGPWGPRVVRGHACQGPVQETHGDIAPLPKEVGARSGNTALLQ